MDGITRHQSPLRRFREVVCGAVASGLWWAAWALQHEPFEGTTGHRVLAVLTIAEALFLGTMFALEARGRRRPELRRWITLAWASLPLWVAIDVIAGSALRTITS